MHISIYSVGGTIDKVYFDKLSEYMVGGPSVRDILKNLNLNFTYSVYSVLRKDSLDMTDTDRQKVYKRIRADRNNKILITHGTDTMIQTARVLSKIKGKTIVLTGAMEPAGFKSSDATFNIGFALAGVHSLQHGVYIAMNGAFFRPEEVEKNRKRKMFVGIKKR